MSDEEEESMSEGFSASEEEWNPGKELRNGESSDDDDSDFEEVPKVVSGRNNEANITKKNTKLAGVLKQCGPKKRKAAGQSLRAKLYNKYRPPPKTVQSPTRGQNSPSASTSRGKPKNYQTPNEENEDSDTDGSVHNYFVNSDDIDLRSSFYRGMRVSENVGGNEEAPAPFFDCNAGIKDRSDSDSEDNESSNEEKSNKHDIQQQQQKKQKNCKAFDFLNLLENANSLERAKREIANKFIDKETKLNSYESTTNVIDVNSLLALGEKQNQNNVHNKISRAPIKDDDEEPEEIVTQLSKTKSKRIKRHTKTRPASTVATGDTDDSDWEEVADTSNLSQHKKSQHVAGTNLEIHVDLPDSRRKRESKTQTKLELENALRRKINRNLKDRQFLLHKASLLCQFGRSYYYNRLLNNRSLMQAALKLLPSKNSYPTESGTEIKYFASLTTWYKTTMKLQHKQFYPDYPRQQLKHKFLRKRLHEQIKEKQACCKQDMIFIFVSLLRGMGLHCRLVINLQPLPMKPAASDLLPMKLKPDKEQWEEKEVIHKSPNEKKSVKTKSNHSKSEQKSIVPKIRIMKEEADVDICEPSVRAEIKITRSKAKQIDINKREYPKPEASLNKLSKNTKINREESPSEVDAITKKEAAYIKVVITKCPEKIQKPKAAIATNMKETKTVGRVLRQRNKNTQEESTSLKATLSIPQLDGTNDVILEDTKPKRNKRPQLKKLRNNEDEASDDVFQPSVPKKAKAPKLQRENRSVLSSDEDENEIIEGVTEKSIDIKNSKKNPNAVDIWVEAWSDSEEQWICIDVFSGKVHSVESIRKSASTNMAYVYAFQNDLSLKDVTARYAPNWSNVIKKFRVEKTWLDEALSAFCGHRSKRDIKEDQELRRIHEEKPLPTSISDYKNHPFYVLERHLLKYEAIYPPDVPTLGFIRKEPVYPRDCVHNLHTREIWFKEARVVKPGETAYKIKLRPKWDRTTRKILKDVPMELFGYWQTMDYDPPTAENGIVPRNEYGNVELFKPCMLPKKCVHLRLPGLARVCKKLDIDCASAVVGFDFHQGHCHPEYDGFVICEEVKDTVIDAWNQEQEEIDRRDREKYESRVYGNWKKLVRGLVIRERIKNKYNMK